MKYLLLVGICSISVLSSCNLRPITYTVSMNSNTLIIDNAVATKNQNYEAKISLIDSFEDYRLPNLIAITIANKELSDEDYVYDYNSGKLTINSNAINGNITITGERVELDAYKATFTCDNHIKVFVYKNRDYGIEPIESKTAYSRDKGSGLKVKDGTGEINFKVEIEENYDIDLLWVKGLYNKCQDKEKTEKDDVYRITEIRGDLQVKLLTKKIYCKNLAASDNLVNNSFTFKWATRKSKSFDHINIDVTAEDYSEHFETTDESFTFNNAILEKRYKFNFTPILTNNETGYTVSCNRFITTKENVSGLPRIEIETENNIVPTINYPVADYVENITKIYDVEDNVIYDSSENLSIDKKYEGSKIKIRGNSSAVNYEKKPYKIKLKKDQDLLKTFRSDSEDIDYTHKEWLLLSPNTNNNWVSPQVNSEIFHTPIGFAVANALNFIWKPAYQFVTLYLNGDYQGLYILSECTSKGNGQGENQSRYKIDENGFIIEKDYYWSSENLYIETPINDSNKVQFTFKYPDTDDITSESSEYLYIKQYLLTLENLILENNPDYYDFIDRDSLIKWLLAQDILSNEDYIGSNIFLYKKDSSNKTKLNMGTIWDFGMTLKKPDSLALIRDKENFYYKWLLKQEAFKNDLKTLYDNNKTGILEGITICLDNIDNNLFDKLLAVEAKKWNFEPTSISDQKLYLNNFFTSHFNYLDNNL